MFDLAWDDKRERRKAVKEYVWRFLLNPDFWADPAKKLPNGLVWHNVEFDIANVLSIPTGHGIYCFTVTPPSDIGLFETKYLLYVGKASSAKLRSRYKNYIDEMNNIGIGKQKPRIKVQEMLNLWKGHIRFHYTVMDKRIIAANEDVLLNTFMPYVNTSIPEAQISEEYRHIY